MALPFIDRPPSTAEIERLRLILSTFQDGSGQQRVSPSKTLPGWRDFERSVALAFGGEAQESKYIFDVLIQDPDRSDKKYGISCKMRRTLNETMRTGHVTIELSNSSGEFWAALGKRRINQKNYKRNPQIVGEVLIQTVENWHREVSIERGGNVDVSKSFYTALAWNKKELYQLFQFSIELPQSARLEWATPVRKAGKKSVPGRRIVGYGGAEKFFEWYGESGGQLKYYPLVQDAIWRSDPFKLEPLPANIEEYGLLAKAASYFPDLWNDANRNL